MKNKCIYLLKLSLSQLIGELFLSPLSHTSAQHP